VRVEYAPDDELRGDGAVPVVLLEAERDVVPSDTAQAVQLRSLPEGNRASGVEPVATNAKPQMLAVTDRCELRDLARRREQRHQRIAETERREPTQLAAQLERQLRAAGQYGIDDRSRQKILVAEKACRLCGERGRECIDAIRSNRQTGGGAMAAEALEVL